MNGRGGSVQHMYVYHANSKNENNECCNVKIRVQKVIFTMKYASGHRNLGGDISAIINCHFVYLL